MSVSQEARESSADTDCDADETEVIEGVGEPIEGGLDWDEKSRNLMRQIVTQKVELPISRLRQMIDDKEIDLAPGFQRRLRWSRAQKSRLIESVIMNVPIPPVFLGESKPGRYVVLDGRQRLTALYEFLSDGFRLSGLEVWSELNGKKFKSLASLGDPPIASAITRRFIPAILILHESVPEVKYEVFDRLNTGGVIAEPMEVRNAIYHGPFNSLLHALSDNHSFRTLWGIPVDDAQRARSGAYRKMLDLEMVLRFFAFQEYKSFSGSVKTFLNDFMSERNSRYKEDPHLEEGDRALFESTITRVLDMLGPDALHRIDASTKQRSPLPSAPLSDAIMFAVSKLDPAMDSPEQGARIRGIVDHLCLDDENFYKAISTGTNAKASAQYRIERLAREVLSLDQDAPIP